MRLLGLLLLCCIPLVYSQAGPSCSTENRVMNPAPAPTITTIRSAIPVCVALRLTDMEPGCFSGSLDATANTGPAVRMCPCKIACGCSFTGVYTSTWTEQIPEVGTGCPDVNTVDINVFPPAFCPQGWRILTSWNNVETNKFRQQQIQQGHIHSSSPPMIQRFERHPQPLNGTCETHTHCELEPISYLPGSTF